MSVVRRCSNCGTSQAAPGECEACHEAQVRYFCTNHSPGLWLESASCARCGAHFGAPTSPTAPPPVPVRSRPPVPAPRGAPAARDRVVPAPPIVHSPASRGTPTARISRGPERPLVADEGKRDLAAPAPVPWQKLLGLALRGGAALARTRRERSIARRAPSGCLFRFLVFVGVLLAGLLMAVFLGGRAFLHAIQPY